MSFPMPVRRLPPLVILLACQAHALPTDRDQPVSVSADSASFNEKTGIAQYTGNILIQQGSLKIHADSLVVTTDAKGTVVSAVATGNPATFEQQPAANKGVARAEALEVNYLAIDGIVSLKGAAKLVQDGSSFRGASISYNLDRGEIEAKSDTKSRVELVFPPPPKDSRQSRKLGEPTP